MRASAGCAVHLPKGVVHQFRNLGSQPGTFLIVATPGGLEAFIAECGSPCVDPASPPPVTSADFKKMVDLCPKYGLTLYPDWAPSGRAPGRPAARTVNAPGQRVDLKLTSADTAGTFCVVEITTRAGEGFPAHLHQLEDQLLYVLEGDHDFLLGDGSTARHLHAPPGTFIHVPARTLHASRNVGATTGRLLSCYTPGGIENLFLQADVADLGSDHARALAARYGVEIAV
jgi:mannose-6-phosphate isomerase-like protein (cupin superfamily)